MLLPLMLEYSFSDYIKFFTVSYIGLSASLCYGIFDLASFVVVSLQGSLIYVRNVFVSVLCVIVAYHISSQC